MHNEIISRILHSSTTWNTYSIGKNLNTQNSSSIPCVCTSSICCKAKSSVEKLSQLLAANSSTIRRSFCGSTTQDGEQKRSKPSISCTILHVTRRQTSKTKTGRLKKWVEKYNKKAERKRNLLIKIINKKFCVFDFYCKINLRICSLSENLQIIYNVNFLAINLAKNLVTFLVGMWVGSSFLSYEYRRS